MDTKKLDKWAELLLGTGKRNNLVNFKDTKSTTVEVLLPSPDALFEKVEGATVFEVFDPRIAEEEDIVEDSAKDDPVPKQEEPEVAEELDDSSEKTDYLTRFSGKLKRQSQLLLYKEAADPLIALKSIDKKTREFIEETGVNVAHMAFGFIHWKERDAAGTVFRAPVLLVPIRLEQASAIDPYFIRSTEDDIIVNPTFS